MILRMNPPKGSCKILMSHTGNMFVMHQSAQGRIVSYHFLCYLHYKAAGGCNKKQNKTKKRRWNSALKQRHLLRKMHLT